MVYGGGALFGAMLLKSKFCKFTKYHAKEFTLFSHNCIVNTQL